jgi:3D-(3,5/4)-trihydroxycyclohexane-1,2-dione acylhydrolase (decyclizing)
MTMAQAVVRFMTQQRTARDGREQPFFGGVFGSSATATSPASARRCTNSAHPSATTSPQRTGDGAHRGGLREDAQPAAHARLHLVDRAGATNMITGAAGATINRVPVLLLPGDIFAGRGPAPVLQQLESSLSQDVSVNDCFKPVSRYWDRINRPEQIVTALPEAMRVLTSPAETGAVTLALPQDVQAEAYDYPAALFEPRVWTIARARADRDRLQEAAAAIRRSTRPIIVAGGGCAVQRSDRCAAVLRRRHRHPGRRNASWEGIAARSTSVVSRRHRRHRNARRQRPRARCRPRHRDRIAAQ